MYQIIKIALGSLVIIFWIINEYLNIQKKHLENENQRLQNEKIKRELDSE